MNSITKYTGTFTKVFVTAATSVVGLTVFALPALAGVGVGVAPDFPATVTVGQTAVPVGLEITNNSTADVGSIDLSNIRLVPQCGDTDADSTTCITVGEKDPGVFTMSASGTGANACAGINFTIAENDATTGQVLFTPSATTTLAQGATCRINFTASVNKVPVNDASIAAGAQTLQIGKVTGTQTAGGELNGTGVGTDITTVNKATPIILTFLSTTTANVGTSVHDTATISSSTPTAGGTVTYTAYSNDACSAGARDAGTKVVTNGIVPNSDALVFNTAGTFYWQVIYSGDLNNNAATSTCTDEIVTIIQPLGHLVVQKTTIPGGDLTVFAIHATGTGAITGSASSTITDAIDANYEVTPGTYYVAETVPAGWTKTGDTCQGVVVAAGATTTCMITNTKIVAAEYCSPGYWKQSQHFDSYVGYLPTTMFGSVFANAFPGKTLVQVLSTGGGGLTAFGRATVGGLLNASALNSGTTTAGVIATFNAVYANAPSGNSNGYYGNAQSLFTAPENCPLN